MVVSSVHSVCNISTTTLSQVAPSKFVGDATLDVLTAQIEAKFADRVIANVGLCVGLHGYDSIGDPYVYPSDGAAHYKARSDLPRFYFFFYQLFFFCRRCPRNQSRTRTTVCAKNTHYYFLHY